MSSPYFVAALATAAYWPTFNMSFPQMESIQKYGPVGRPPSRRKKKKAKPARKRK